MTGLHIHVVGTPAPQGSKRHVGNGIMVESSKKVKPWRQDVRAAAMVARQLGAGDERHTMLGPLEVHVCFTFTRPKHHYRTGRNAHLLRDNAPGWVSTRPDLDKCLRSTLDALGEAGVWRDDAQVARVAASKVYCDLGELPGAYIFIFPLVES